MGTLGEVIIITIVKTKGTTPMNTQHGPITFGENVLVLHQMEEEKFKAMNVKIEIIGTKAKLKNATISHNFVSIQAAVDEARTKKYNVINKDILTDFFRKQLEG